MYRLNLSGTVDSTDYVPLYKLNELNGEKSYAVRLRKKPTYAPSAVLSSS